MLLLAAGVFAVIIFSSITTPMTAANAQEQDVLRKYIFFKDPHCCC
jgi:hypothetical protein